MLKLEVIPCHPPLPPPSWGTTFQLKAASLLNNCEQNKEVCCHLYLLWSCEGFQLKTDFVVWHLMWPHPKERPCVAEINSNRDRLVKPNALLFSGMLCSSALRGDRLPSSSCECSQEWGSPQGRADAWGVVVQVATCAWKMQMLSVDAFKCSFRGPKV